MTEWTMLSFRAESRNGASGTSDMDGCAVKVAARESGDERVNLSPFISRDVSRLRSTTARQATLLDMTATEALVAARPPSITAATCRAICVWRDQLKKRGAHD